MDSFSLTWFYDDFPRIEDEFRRALDESLSPRGPGMLHELVGDLGLPAGSLALDVGCGEGADSIELASRFGFDVVGIDPVQRHIELSNARLADTPPPRPQTRFVLGSVEELPAADASADLVWCKDVLVHVADLEGAYLELARVLRRGGRAVVYQMCDTDRLEPREAQWLWTTMGVVASSAHSSTTLDAIASAGLRLDRHIVVGSEWGEWACEATGKMPYFLRTARLLRAPDTYIRHFGREAYDVMLGDCLWHVYAMIGKLSRHIFMLTNPD